METVREGIKRRARWPRSAIDRRVSSPSLNLFSVLPRCRAAGLDFLTRCASFWKICTGDTCIDVPCLYTVFTPILCWVKTLPPQMRWAGFLFVQGLSALLAWNWVPIIDYQYKYAFKEQLFEVEFFSGFHCWSLLKQQGEFFSPLGFKNWKRKKVISTKSITLNWELVESASHFYSYRSSKVAESVYGTNCWRISMSNGGVKIGCFYKDSLVSGRAIMDLERF